VTNSVLFVIYTARFPFLETESGKVRPIIVVSKPYGAHNVIAVVPISSTAIAERVDVSLSEWEQEGLLKSSVARVHRLSTMLQVDLLSELGPLQSEDVRSLQNSLRNYLQL
jgi:mRNA-degrading endonuclease toxin of MazEF toxin-antitoxin module